MSFFKKWLSRGNKEREPEYEAPPEVSSQISPEVSREVPPEASPEVAPEVTSEAEVPPVPERNIKKKPYRKPVEPRQTSQIQGYVSPDDFVRRNKEWDERRDSRRTSVAQGGSRDWSRNGSFSYGSSSNMGWVHPPWM